MTLAQDDDVVEAVAPNGAGQALGERILPRALRRREDFVDAHALHALPKVLAVDLVTIAQEVGWCGVIREGVVLRNVRQVCEGGVGRFGIRRETVRSATSMPS